MPNVRAVAFLPAFAARLQNAPDQTERLSQAFQERVLRFGKIGPAIRTSVQGARTMMLGCIGHMNFELRGGTRRTMALKQFHVEGS